ncbi:phosphatidic acid phosphatase type 2/haloperoxidase [Syncephalastrum racemosum]|uniref:Dolichyldiphosphatase n=1 Tax=Syncephalastrum racemosum TaxID=13706 RepID=A0A1X2HII5_SYNRA|nr:phosphatidic acid phosphatase type 2/haloperoxidase [Syncephalastrum racemosum]
MMEGVTLTSLSLTHVQFNSDDKIAYALAYITLSPLAILVFYASVIVSRREIAGILMLLGQLLNEAFNAILKESLQLRRPHEHLGDGYGMPSSHAQFMGFFAAYAMIVLSGLVMYSRIYLGYHTAAQVAVGLAIGIMFGVAWFLFTDNLRHTPRLKALLQHPIAKKIYLKDMHEIQNVALWEYQQWERTQRKSD